MTSTRSKASQAESINARMANLARKRQVPFDRLKTLFLLERAATRLASDPELADHLVFKGGFVSVRAYGSPRFTVDLDALLRNLSKDVAMPRIKQSLCRDFDDGVWFAFEDSIDLTTQGEYGGIRCVFRGGIGHQPSDLSRTQVIHVDVGIGDPVVPAPKEIELESLLGEGDVTWQVYPIETIVSEKLHTLVARGAANSRSKDVFDLALLLPRAEPELLAQSLAATFEFRGDAVPNSFVTVVSNLERALLRRGWNAAAGYIAGAPSFDDALDQIIAELKRRGL